MKQSLRFGLLLQFPVWVVGALISIGSLGACKTSAHLGVGAVQGGPVLIHAPMGIGRVRFQYRETGKHYDEQQTFTDYGTGGSYRSGPTEVTYFSGYGSSQASSTTGTGAVTGTHWV